MKARLPQGFGGGAPANQKDLMRQAQKMQEMMAAKQAELEERSFTAGAGGGMVEVTVNGKKQLTSLVINPEIVDPEDVDMLADVVMAAANEALKLAEETTSREMEQITGKLSLPGMPGLF